MAFKAIKKKKYRPDCKDFKPFFFDKRYCKYSFKCANAGSEYTTKRYYDMRGCFDLRCTGCSILINNKEVKLPESDPNLVND